MRQSQFLQALFRFPFFDADLFLPQHQKIRRVGRHHVMSYWSWVVQVQPYIWLVKELQHLWVILHGIDGPQFDGVALELNRAPHLAAGVGATHVVGTPLDASPWRGHAETREQIVGFGAQLEPTTPLFKGGGLHPILPLAAPLRAQRKS